MQVYVKSTGDTPFPSPFTVTLTNDIYTLPQNSWNYGTPSLADGVLSGTMIDAWQAQQLNGRTNEEWYRFGMVMPSADVTVDSNFAFMPSAVTINGERHRRPLVCASPAELSCSIPQAWLAPSPSHAKCP